MVLPENSPSKVAASEKPLSRFISPPALTRAASGSPRAPFTTKLAPGSGWNSAVGIVIVRPCSAAAQRQPRPPPTDVSRIAHAEPLNSGNDIGNGSSVCES